MRVLNVSLMTGEMDTATPPTQSKSSSTLSFNHSNIMHPLTNKFRKSISSTKECGQASNENSKCPHRVYMSSIPHRMAG